MVNTVANILGGITVLAIVATLVGSTNTQGIISSGTTGYANILKAAKQA